MFSLFLKLFLLGNLFEQYQKSKQNLKVLQSFVAHQFIYIPSHLFPCLCTLYPELLLLLLHETDLLADLLQTVCQLRLLLLNILLCVLHPALQLVGGVLHI